MSFAIMRKACVIKTLLRKPFLTLFRNAISTKLKKLDFSFVKHCGKAKFGLVVVLIKKKKTKKKKPKNRESDFLKVPFLHMAFDLSSSGSLFIHFLFEKGEVDTVSYQLVKEKNQLKIKKNFHAAKDRNDPHTYLDNFRQLILYVQQIQ